MSRSYDLDLLRYLQVLVEEQSVTSASMRMGVSEPTMSRHLKKLRDVFNDPILVQSGRTMVATVFANRIQERVQHLVREADRLTDQQDDVDFSNIAPRFTIRTSDLIVSMISTNLLTALRRKCPHVEICFVPENDEYIGDTLRSKHTDLYLGATDDLHPETRRQNLLSTSFQCLVRTGHPILAQAITPQSLIHYDHVSVSRRGRGRGPIDAVLEERYGLHRRIALVVPSYHAMIDSIRITDLLLPLPDMLIDSLPLENIGLLCFPFPFELPSVQIFQAWHPRNDNDPVHRWLRDTVFQTIRGRKEKNMRGFE